jgi:hypothetical protein
MPPAAPCRAAAFRLAPLGAALALLGSTSGCGLLIGQLGSRDISSTAEQTAPVMIHSEPPGAHITRGGLSLGTTPALVDLTYSAEVSKAHGRCWLPLSLGLVDLGTGAAIAWAGNRYSDTPAFAFTGILYAGLSFLVGEVLGIACYLGEQETTIVKRLPREHTLSLSAGGWEQALAVRVPLASNERQVTAVIQGLEEADWQKAKKLDTANAYQAYLKAYPHGREMLRREAEHRIDELAWRRAKEQNTIAACKDYLSEHPHGRWERDAHDRIEQLTWERTQAQDTPEAYERYLGQYPSGQWKSQAEAALEKAAWQAAERENTEKAYRDFLRRHPSSTWKQAAGLALERIENASWQAAERKNTAKAYVQFLDHYPSSTWKQAAALAIRRILETDPQGVGDGTLWMLLLNPGWGCQSWAARAYLQRGQTSDLTQILDEPREFHVRESILGALNDVAAGSPQAEGKAARDFLCSFASSTSSHKMRGPDSLDDCSKLDTCDARIALSLPGGNNDVKVYCKSGRVAEFSGYDAVAQAREFSDSMRNAVSKCEKRRQLTRMGEKLESEDASRLRQLAGKYCGGARR